MLRNLLLAVLISFSAVASGQSGPNNPYEPVQVVTNGSMSASICATSSDSKCVPVNVMAYGHVGIQFIWTGTPTGVLGVSVSSSGVAGTYTPLTLTGLQPPANQPAGSAGSWFLDLSTNPNYLEVTYTAGSGSGTLQAFVGAKK